MSLRNRKAQLRHSFLNFANTATDIAHDVASPLQVMTGYLEHFQALLQAQELNREELTRVFNRLRMSTARFKNTIDHLTIERQKDHQLPEWVQMEALTKRALKLMVPTLQSWNVFIQFHGQNDTSLRQVSTGEYNEFLLNLFGDWIANWKVKSAATLDIHMKFDSKGLFLSFTSPILLPNPPALVWQGKKISFEKTKMGWQVHLTCQKKPNQSQSAA